MVVCNSSRSDCWDGLLEDEGAVGDVSASTLVAASLFSFGIVRPVWNDNGGGTAAAVVVIDEDDDFCFLNPNDDGMVILSDGFFCFE